MIVVFKDIITGEIVESNFPASIWWWAEGNGSCDCNRALLFNGLSEMLEGIFGEDTCFGAIRCYAIDLKDDTERTIQHQIDEFNTGIADEWEKLHTKEDVLRYINQSFPKRDSL